MINIIDRSKDYALCEMSDPMHLHKYCIITTKGDLIRALNSFEDACLLMEAFIELENSGYKVKR